MGVPSWSGGGANWAESFGDLESGNQIDAAMIFARSNLVNVIRFHFRRGCRFTTTANRTAGKIVCKTSCFTSIWLLATKIGACAQPSDRRRLPPLCGATISEIKTAITTAKSVRFMQESSMTYWPDRSSSGNQKRRASPSFSRCRVESKRATIPPREELGNHR
jgi:hypothetical protein